MKRLAIICAIAASCLSHPAMAAKIVALQGVTLQGGGTLSGTFKISDDFSQLLAVDISSSANSSWLFSYGAVNYNSLANASWSYSSSPTLVVNNALGTQQVKLNLMALSGTGGNISTYNSSEFQLLAGTRAVISGTVAVVTAPIPEPGAWVTMIGGFALIGGLMRRRKATLSFG
jgi:hypothetical protein